MIFIDDLGWGDVGCYGNDFIDTPNIDQLAKDGMRFTDFYAAGAVCSPTRCAVHDRPASAICERDWKLIEYLDGTGDIQLYHIANDVSEYKNLASERKGKVADLKQKLSAWRSEVLAHIPIPNPSYNSKRANEWWSRRSGKPIDSNSRKRFPESEKQL